MVDGLQIVIPEKLAERENAFVLANLTLSSQRLSMDPYAVEKSSVAQ